MAQGRKLEKGYESVEQRIAFEKYCELGDERNLDKVAVIMKRAIPTIQRWSKAFGWVERSRTVDKNVIDTVSIESLVEQTESKKRNLKLIDIMLREAAVIDEDGNIVSSKVKLKSMTDIRTALEVREALLGREKGSNKGGDTNIDKAVFIIKKG